MKTLSFCPSSHSDAVHILTPCQILFEIAEGHIRLQITMYAKHFLKRIFSSKNDGQYDFENGSNSQKVHKGGKCY